MKKRGWKSSQIKHIFPTQRTQMIFILSNIEMKEMN